MTRIVDGTVTLGPLKGTPAGVYAYAFQRLGNGRAVAALWTHDNAQWSERGGFNSSRAVNYGLAVDGPGTSGKVTVLDMMGNASEAPYVNGRVALALTAAPVYVVSDNAAFMKTNVNPPAGYVAR